MRYDRERGDDREGGGDGTHRLLYALGAVGGVALGVVLSRAFEGLAGGDAATRIRGLPARFVPGRLRRGARERAEQLTLEDTVLEVFLADEVLSWRGIDVGVVSPGIVELSGSVWTRDEARRAVGLAQRIQGVETVINRMDVDDERARLHPRSDDEESTMSGAEWTGRGQGMGSRRQGRETDPARTDDHHHQIDDALAKADRAQYEEEGIPANPRMGARPGHGDPHERTHYAEDELDNQDPYGKHAIPVPEQPQALNTASRVGEGLKPGTELELEAADLPVKPHGRPLRPEDEA